jgi:menaquinone-dependent protoporphyrinogen oxidase
MAHLRARPNMRLMADRKRILVLFASTHGQTRSIAERIATTLREQGFEVEMQDAGKLPADLSLGLFAGVVIGASIHAHHQGEAVDFARNHHLLLNSLPTAFFSVSLAAADEDDQSRAATREYLDEFLDATGLQPTLSQSFAGAILFSHRRLRADPNAPHHAPEGPRRRQVGPGVHRLGGGLPLRARLRLGGRQTSRRDRPAGLTVAGAIWKPRSIAQPGRISEPLAERG